MMSRHEGVRHTDTLVLGSGLAGMYAALRAAEHGDVLIATSTRIQDSSSFWAQGGVAAAVGTDDTTELHEADTLRVGRGLCRESAVELLTEEAPRHLERLGELGVDFEASAGALALALEAGHSRRRIAHAGGGGTGRVIVEALVQRVLENERITVLDNTSAWSLLSDGERCYGAHTTGGALLAGSTVLATGGSASLYERSTNPASSRGEGVAFAWRAGADIADMEFIQFHPTALVLPGVGTGFLISEAVRGEGAPLLNRQGERFMLRRHPDAELAPRDELSRAIADELRDSAHHCVYITVAHLDPDVIRTRFSSIATRLAELGLDFARDPIPVAPAAHYTMGGVLTDLDGGTTLPGLLACGEVACTGVHGANRLASNSLLECLVFADRAGAARVPFAEPPAELLDLRPPAPVADEVSLQRIRELLWRGAGVTRDADSLREVVALAGIDLAGGSPVAAPVSGEQLVAGLIGHSALLREESRGAHFRRDYPGESGLWKRHIVQRAGHEPELRAWA
jgi:L-aspartate oxidase